MAAVALTMTPALAKSKKHRHHGYEQSYRYGPQYGWYGPRYGWNSRYVSDPSFGNRAGINNARRTADAWPTSGTDATNLRMVSRAEG